MMLIKTVQTEERRGSSEGLEKADNTLLCKCILSFRKGESQGSE
jgi:hypothetical protein